MFCPEKVKYRTHVTPLTERYGTERRVHVHTGVRRVEFRIGTRVTDINLLKVLVTKYGCLIIRLLRITLVLDIGRELHRFLIPWRQFMIFLLLPIPSFRI